MHAHIYDRKTLNGCERKEKKSTHTWEMYIDIEQLIN